ncbi:hypothetical protein F2Q69_00023586 [Brassica cretica]|uniref:Uncharacterized protein n=1 Tax=Brassica cretica TaxID=69181 RepID=A0A8S9QC38_BRACR|nr:hypothetical protein F2Q69_00023586 [Brassica cretica]
MFLGEWRSDLPTVLPIRTKRLDIFPKDIQKQISEAKRMATLPDLSTMLAAQLGLVSEEGPSTTVLRTGEVPPSGARNAGKGKKRKRGGSGVEGTAEEASDVPPSGEPQKKKKKQKKRTKKPVDEQSENPEEPTEIEEGDVQEEELQPEEEASEAEISGERDDAAVVGEGEESEISLNAARPDGSEEDSGESPLLIRRRNDEVGDEARSPILASSREGTPVPIGEGVAQIGTSSRPSLFLINTQTPSHFFKFSSAIKVQRLSRQQKGKSVPATLAPARNPDGGCTGDLESAHHTAMMDAVNLSRSQRLLVADATRLAREGSENVAVRDATECERDGQSGAESGDLIFRPFFLFAPSD